MDQPCTAPHIVDLEVGGLVFDLTRVAGSHEVTQATDATEYVEVLTEK